MLTVGLFQSNCFIVSCPETSEGIIVDACDDPERILQYVRDNELEVKFVVNTHAHIDHVMALADVVEALSVPVLMHKAEMSVYNAIPNQAVMFGLREPKLVKIDRYIAEGDAVEFGTLTGRVVESPGHSPGGICLLFDSAKPPRGFVGDVVFRGSIGRTDLPGADHMRMIETLRNVIMKLPDDMIIYSGHGPATTIAQEKMSNPFLLELA